MRAWVPPPTLIIQPDALLVPGRVGYVEPVEWEEYRHGAETLYLERYDDPLFFASLTRGIPRGLGAHGWTSHVLTLDRVGIARWDLSGLTLDELESLAVAVDAQLNAGPGTLRPTAVAEQQALRLRQRSTP